MKQFSQVTGALKFCMHISEIMWINVLFFIVFNGYFREISYAGESLSQVSMMGLWLASLLSLCYIVGIWMRPISFYYRSSRSGSIVQNVVILSFYMAVLFLCLVGFSVGLSIFTIKKLLLFYFLVVVVLILLRYFARWTIRYIRCHGRNIHRVVFVGGKDNILELYQEMKNPFYGYKVLGYFCESPITTFPEELTYLGDVSATIPFLQKNHVQQLYCCLPSAQAEDIRPIINHCERNCIRFFSVPNVRTYLKRSMQLEMLGSVPVLYIREDPLMLIENRFIKRAWDIFVSGLVMIPFWLLIYPVVGLITKITSPGPIFFKQQRNGLNGEVFYCYKFRSMKVNADADKMQATKDDPRKTKFGNFLRKSSIDELPQFINVLKGDMSIVGPRPHMVKHTEEYSALIDKYMVRHWVRPGITGWAQVNGARGETQELWQMEDRIKKDVWYIENWTFFLDIKIMFLTVWNAVAGDKQAY